MVTMGNDYFSKQNAKMPHIAFERDFQLSKAALTEGIIQPLSFKAALLSKLPKNFDVLRLVLQFLKVLGQAPFSYDPVKDSYYFIWPCLDTAVSLGVAVIASFWFFIFITHIVLEKFLLFGPGIRNTYMLVEEALKSNVALDERKIQVNKTCFAFLNASLVLQQLEGILCGWAGRQKLIQFMNSWVDLKRNLKTFVKSDSRKATAETVHYYVVLCLPVACYLATGVMFISFTTSVPSHADRALEITIFSFVFGYLLTVESLKDYALVLGFYELMNNFRQVREQMLLDINAGNISEKRVDTWRGLILSIRKQTEKASDYMSYPQLAILLQCILLGTVAIFIVLVGGYGSLAGVKEYCLGTFLWLLLRLFCKAWFAEQVTLQEAMIARELLERNLKSCVSIETELRDLRSFLLSHPTEINFANIVVLRKSVCLGVISQIVTYLIVLIQFYN